MIAKLFNENAVNIYTDGSSMSGPRAGGIGIVFVVVNEAGDEVVVNSYDYSGYPGATNNEMELEACIIALDEALTHQRFKSYDTVAIYSDSRFVTNNYKNAMFNWPNTGWKNRKTRRPIKHVSQWKRLLRLMKRAQRDRRTVTIQWEKGKTHEYNKAADKAAKRSAHNPINKPLSHVTVKRKLSDREVEVGSVKMLGQRLLIRPITSEWLPSPHQCFRYKYEVLSKGSRFYRSVDFIFSTEVLSRSCRYMVLVNKETANPWIVRKLKELPRNESGPTSAGRQTPKV